MNQNNPFDDLYELPKDYKFPKFSRYFTLSLGLLVIVYVIFIIFTQLNSESSTFMKVIPFIIAFLSLDSVTRNLFTLNRVKITDQGIRFMYLAKKSIYIPWLRINKIEIYKGKGRMFVIYYTENSEEKKYYMTMQFPKMIEILNLIAYLAPHTEFDEFVKSLLVAPKKEEI